MLKIDRRAVEELNAAYPGIKEQILRFERTELSKCPKCGSDDTAAVSVGIVGRSINIAAATTKVKLFANGQAPGAYFCNACNRFFDGSCGMDMLLVGFDSAWTEENSGAIVGVVRKADGKYRHVGGPQKAHFYEATKLIRSWQAKYPPGATIVMLDQPTIVRNGKGQRPVENIVASAVSSRGGGVQPASLSRREMFGKNAPVRAFLKEFGGAADPGNAVAGERVFETYPVLTIIAEGWDLKAGSKGRRLPKYNPSRRKTFNLKDWRHVCRKVAAALDKHGLTELSKWAKDALRKKKVSKSDQDCLDACICLLTAIQFASREDCLMVGQQKSGHMVVPFNEKLCNDLRKRCRCGKTKRRPERWVRKIRMARRR